MITSGAIHYGLSLLNIPIHIRDICVFLAPIFSGLTALATYLLTKELWNEGAGLFAACFIAIGNKHSNENFYYKIFKFQFLVISVVLLLAVMTMKELQFSLSCLLIIYG